MSSSLQLALVLVSLKCALRLLIWDLFFLLFTVVTAITVIVTFLIRTSFEQILFAFYSVVFSFAFSFYSFMIAALLRIVKVCHLIFAYWEFSSFTSTTDEWFHSTVIRQVVSSFSISLSSLRLVVLLTLCPENVLRALEKMWRVKCCIRLVSGVVKSFLLSSCFPWLVVYCSLQLLLFYCLFFLLILSVFASSISVFCC